VAEPVREDVPPPRAEADPLEAGQARVVGGHILRMVETRMDAAAVAFQCEADNLVSRLRFRLLAVGALFMTIWAGIVLLAVALPENWRVPVLAAVVAALAIAAIAAQVFSKRHDAGTGVGSLRWFLDGLREDIDVVARAMAPPLRAVPPAEPAPPGGTPSNDPGERRDAA
jgi:uncharacterized membrane protein YqjE